MISASGHLSINKHFPVEGVKLLVCGVFLVGIEHEILNNSVLSRTTAGNLLIFLRAHPGFC